jgi:hypothetical protein
VPRTARDSRVDLHRLATRAVPGRQFLPGAGLPGRSYTGKRVIQPSREEGRRGFRALAHKCFAVCGLAALGFAAVAWELTIWSPHGPSLLSLPLLPFLPFVFLAALMALGCAVNLYNDLTVAPLGVLTLVVVGVVAKAGLGYAELSGVFLAYGVVVLGVTLRELVPW